MHHHAHRFPWVLGIETRLCTTGVSLTVLISSPLSFFPLTGSLNLILAENDLKVLILLPSAPQCWNYGCVSLCPVHVVLEMEPRALLECQARTLPTEPRLQAPCFSFLWFSDSHSEIHATCPLSLFSTPQTPSDSHGRRWTPRRAAGGGGRHRKFMASNLHCPPSAELVFKCPWHIFITAFPNLTRLLTAHPPPPS